MIFEVKSLAILKHQETKHDALDWTKALESARLTLKLLTVDYQGLEHIALASRSPAHFTVMTRLIYQYLKSHANGEQISIVILGHVNRSLFSLSDWIDSLDYFYGWLSLRQRKIDFLTMLNYLECCTGAQDAKEAGQTLRALLEDMLDVHGYEGNVDAKCGGEA